MCRRVDHVWFYACVLGQQVRRVFQVAVDGAAPVVSLRNALPRIRAHTRTQFPVLPCVAQIPVQGQLKTEVTFITLNKQRSRLKSSR